MAKDTEPQTDVKPARVFSTAPVPIVVFEMQPYDEPIFEPIVDKITNKTDGIRRNVGRNVGETLHVRSEVAHIEGRTAYPLDGSDALPYGPGKVGHWAKRVPDRK